MLRCAKVFGIALAVLLFVSLNTPIIINFARQLKCLNVYDFAGNGSKKANFAQGIRL